MFCIYITDKPSEGVLCYSHIYWKKISLEIVIQNIKYDLTT